MAAFVAKRIAQIVPVLLVVAFVVFFMLHLIPGDPAEVLAGVYASNEDVQRVRTALGLDRPLHVQFATYLRRLARGDLGKSLRTGQPVSVEIGQRWPWTFRLAFGSMLLAGTAGIAAGIFAAHRHDSTWDYLITGGALFGLSIPAFWLGLMLILIFSVGLGWFPTYGAGSFRHTILPMLTLAVTPAGIIAQLTRGAVLEVLRSDYVRTAYAKGASVTSVLIRHALRNALIPIVTFMGVQFGVLLSGAVVTESVFSWPGVGLLVVDGILQRDFPVVQALILIFALTFMLVNLLVDLSYAFLDPRVHYDHR